MNHTERSALEDHYRFHCHPPLLHNLYEQRLGLYLSLSQEKEESPSLNRKKKKEKKKQQENKVSPIFSLLHYTIQFRSIVDSSFPRTLNDFHETRDKRIDERNRGFGEEKVGALTLKTDEGRGKRKKERKKGEEKDTEYVSTELFSDFFFPSRPSPPCSPVSFLSEQKRRGAINLAIIAARVPRTLFSSPPSWLSRCGNEPNQLLETPPQLRARRTR